MSTIRHILLVLALGCSGSTTPDQAGNASGSGSAYSALGKKPPGARRPTPPPDIEKAATAIGAPAPAIDLPDTAGTSRVRWTLEGALAKNARVMIMFYRGDWCPHCRTQLRELDVNLPELAKRDIALVAISVDEAAAGKHLREKLALAYPILSDPKAESLKAFGIFDKENEIAWASIFIVGRDGSSPTGKVVHRWLADTFSQRVATSDVLAALDKL